MLLFILDIRDPFVDSPGPTKTEYTTFLNVTLTRNFAFRG